MEAAVDNYQIPLILGYYKERWVYGQEAKRLREAGEGDIVTHLFRKAVKRKKVRVGGKIHDGVWLLAKFISMTLKKFEQIDYITFSVPYTNVDMSKMLKGIGKYIGVPGECVFVQDYKESFCQYMFCLLYTSHAGVHKRTSRVQESSGTGLSGITGDL